MNTSTIELVRAVFEDLRIKTGAQPVRTEYSFEDPALRNNTDDFSIRGANGVITFAAGNTRGLFYAVYEYFERFCGCRWFYDCDRIPALKTLPVDQVNFVKQFRYQYRGLRYFAHRSLYRFQAEHWDYDDWKKEIDFLLKKHFSFFMLRTGQDDLFQKAFPDVVPYPPEDGAAPEAELRSYNDRTELISLKYRGELRKKVLSYAFDRGLMHPEDMGPMTHWYSHTPRAFLDRIKPEFMVQSSNNYAKPELQVWNCNDDAIVEYYMQLTRAHIHHYGKPELFHMIGLAERVFGSEEENYAIKVKVFQKFVKRLREEYPDAPLLVASWDFMFRWKAKEVRKFLKDVDPTNTIILDYTTDSGSCSNNYINWNLPHHFPWIFGIFQAYEPQCDLFLDLDRIEEMYIPVQDDPFCKGMVVWSENSHSNPLLLEYLSKKFCEEEFSLATFCHDRYGDLAEPMQELWQLTQKAFACNSWVFGTERPYQGIFSNHFNLLSSMIALSERKPAELYCECARKYPQLEVPDSFFEKAAALAGQTEKSSLIKRDLADLVRSALMCRITRELCGCMMKMCQRIPEKADFSKLTTLITLMGDLLETLPEFSMNHTLAKTAQSGKLNSHAEMTLKGNAENSYCRSYIYELYRAIYIPEAECIMNHAASLDAGVYPDKDFLKAEENRIRDRFYTLPLSEFAPEPAHSFAEFVGSLPEKL